MTAELEAKVIPRSGFRMPSFDRLREGAVTVPQPVRELDATYYDTPDVELARWGITLRYRDGEPGRPWALKFPRQASGALLAREELSFDGDPGQVPAGARDLVRGFTRGRALTPVARLHTTRTPVLVQDADGQPLIEIADDSVSVFDGAREVDHFREIEVEAAHDSHGCRAALASAVAALVDVGGRVNRPIPKLVRALGMRGQGLPSVVVAAVGPHATTTELIRHLITSSLSELLQNDFDVRLGHDPEAVHLYRVAARRLRSDLRTFSRFLADEPTTNLRGELAWMGTAAGSVRDLDVLSTRIATQSRGLADPDQPAASELMARLAVSRLDAQRGLLDAFRSERYDRALQTLVEFASEPPTVSRTGRTATRSTAAVARKLVKRRWKQLAAAVSVVGEEPTDEELHRIRIAAKRCRYAAEAVAPVVERPARRFAAGVERVQTVLGDYHDTVVAEAWLRDAAVELIDCRVAIGGLIAMERQERARLRAAWPAAWRVASKPRKRRWL